MKNIFFFFLAALLFSCGGDGSSATASKINYPSSTEKMHWLTIEEAQTLNKYEPRDMIVDVYTQWCGPCKMMDRMTFSDPTVIEKVHKDYYAVKFDAESPGPVKFGEKEFANPNHDPNKPKNRRNAVHQFSRHLKVSAYPSLVLLNPDLKIKKTIKGFRQPAQLIEEL
jgi:thioredoxin-related protein